MPSAGIDKILTHTNVSRQSVEHILIFFSQYTLFTNHILKNKSHITTSHYAVEKVKFLISSVFGEKGFVVDTYVEACWHGRGVVQFQRC